MTITLPPGLMVSVSGFRGRVGESITPELVAEIATAYGAYLTSSAAGDRVLVGRDSRPSGPELMGSAVAGLLSAGCRVVELGICPTPTLLLAVEENPDAIGGIVVSASHNPAEWNALKLVGEEGLFLDAARSADFQRFLREEDPPRVEVDPSQEVAEDRGAVDRHLARILSLPQVEVERIRALRLPVALDCVHGAGGPIMLSLLEALGCQVASMGMETDGAFPRNPEPTPENLHALGKLVRSSGAKVGMAVDPDVDRLSLVDEGGVPIGEDFTLALAVSVVLARSPGPVVTNLSTSQVVEDAAREHGSTVVRAPVGEINVARRMQAEGAVVGGEGNGGVILPDLHLTRDAPLAAALALQFLAEADATLSEAVSRWPRYSIVKEKMDFPRGALSEAYGVLEGELEPGEVDDSDGLRLAWPDRRAWLHVRPSGTEPVVRLIAEAPNEADAGALVEGAVGCMKKAIN
jgi:phosphomannomutase